MNKKLLSLLLSGLLIGSATMEASWGASVVRAARDFTLAGTLMYLKENCTEKKFNLNETGSVVIFCVSLALFLNGTENLIKACEQS